MRRIINSTYITLDGVVEDPHLWPSLGNAGETVSFDIQNDLLHACDAVLMGRRTYEGFAAVWPTRSGDSYSDRINAMPKYVVSSSLREPAWNNTTVIGADLVGQVETLKQQQGKDIVQYGLGDVSFTLMEHGLIDEIRLWVHPLILGRNGPRVPHFIGCPPARLHLANTRVPGQRHHHPELPAERLTDRLGRLQRSEELARMMTRYTPMHLPGRALLFVGAAGLIAAGGRVLARPAAAPADPPPAALHVALVDEYCLSCHDEDEKKGGLALDAVGAQGRVAASGCVGEGRPEAPRAADAAGRQEGPAGRRDLRRGDRVPGDVARPRGGGASESGPHGDASGGSREPNTRTPSAISSRSRSTSPRCCPPTSPATASTT